MRTQRQWKYSLSSYLLVDVVLILIIIFCLFRILLFLGVVHVVNLKVGSTTSATGRRGEFQEGGGAGTHTSINPHTLPVMTSLLKIPLIPFSS